MKNLTLLIFLVCAFCGVGASFAQTKPASGTPEPKLVIGLVVDQMRWDYLHRFRHHFGNGGFNRLMNEGFNFENAHVPYAPTMTAAGHASIYTGSVPAFHGIVGNEWIDRSSGFHIYCTSDTSVRSLGGSDSQGRMSPVSLLTTTIGDQMKLATDFQSKVFGVSLKDRGAIFPAGRSANAAYWFDDSTGNWITSSWYMKELPKWVKRFNDRKLADSFLNAGWHLSQRPSTYKKTTPDQNEFEISVTGNNNTSFPHLLKHFAGRDRSVFRYMAMGNAFTFDFSKQLLREEHLGKGPVTDLFCISLSATDYVGHKFGTHSLEIEDTYARLDKELASFLSFLDEEIGKDKYVLFLTADHGAPPIPDFLKSQKLSAGNLDNYGLVKEIETYLFKDFGHRNLITHYYNNQYFLNRKLIHSENLNRGLIIEKVIAFLEARKEVVMAFDIERLSEVVLPAGLKEKIANGYYPKRCGDVYVVMKPHFSDYLGRGSEHGTAYAYDTHVPMIFFGNNVSPGKSHRRVSVTDIAPTISALLKIQVPSGNLGEVLEIGNK